MQLSKTILVPVVLEIRKIEEDGESKVKGAELIKKQKRSFG